MSTYAIGDIQGCYKSFRRLLEKIDFRYTEDRLWLVGDLVNRGQRSLETLRRIYDMRDIVVTVLGNHDLSLLAHYHGAAPGDPKRDLLRILEAPDADRLLGWLQEQPLMVVDDELKVIMSHAGLLPTWSLSQAKALAEEVEAQLRGPDYRNFFAAMYGDEPSVWHDELEGVARWRFITNAFTRMRFCTLEGRLDLKNKESAEPVIPGYMPWFEHPGLDLQDYRLVFGHWAALEGKVSRKRVYGLDTGCVWGGKLTALRLEDGEKFRYKCKRP